ncbi:MAG: leucyl/phenylalanyl-tRNA--protein transferase, partial [Phycisphaerales bacterium]
MAAGSVRAWGAVSGGFADIPGSTDEQRCAFLLAAYRAGAFPMAEGGRGRIRFYSPDPRAIVPLHVGPGEPGGVVLSRSLRASIRSGRFVIRCDMACPQVIRACAASRGGEIGGDWISPAIERAYLALHRAGHVHSVEAWREADGAPLLVGGLYGVHIGGAFFGESMFTRADLGGADASKACLVALVGHLRARGCVLLDSQILNP